MRALAFATLTPHRTLKIIGRERQRGKGFFTGGDTPSQNPSMTLYKCDTGVKFVSGFSCVGSLSCTFFLFPITVEA